MDLKLKLDALESRLRRLVEGQSQTRWDDGALWEGLISQLSRELKAALENENSLESTPELFILGISPEVAHLFSQDPVILETIGEIILNAAAEIGIAYPTPPAVRISPDPALAVGEVTLIPQSTQLEASFTSTLDVDIPSNEEIPQGAYLIVDGTQVFSLERSVVNIGRRIDNQLVIDDPRVSRLHAQLRAVQGEYVLFDLESRGGTWVNGERIHQKRLSPGDVVSLAGVPLVYGQDAPALGETQDLGVIE